MCPLPTRRRTTTSAELLAFSKASSAVLERSLDAGHHGSRIPAPDQRAVCPGSSIAEDGEDYATTVRVMLRDLAGDATSCRDLVESAG